MPLPGAPTIPTWLADRLSAVQPGPLGWFSAGALSATAVFLAYILFVSPPSQVRVVVAPRPTPAAFLADAAGAQGFPLDDDDSVSRSGPPPDRAQAPPAIAR